MSQLVVYSCSLDERRSWKQPVVFSLRGEWEATSGGRRRMPQVGKKWRCSEVNRSSDRVFQSIETQWGRQWSFHMNEWDDITCNDKGIENEEGQREWRREKEKKERERERERERKRQARSKMHLERGWPRVAAMQLYVRNGTSLWNGCTFWLHRLGLWLDALEFLVLPTWHPSDESSLSAPFSCTQLSSLFSRSLLTRESLCSRKICFSSACFATHRCWLQPNLDTVEKKKTKKKKKKNPKQKKKKKKKQFLSLSLPSQR